jgi:DNA-directed RNA polymerase specialized sigma54-like protein
MDYKQKDKDSAETYPRMHQNETRKTQTELLKRQAIFYNWEDQEQFDDQILLRESDDEGIIQNKIKVLEKEIEILLAKYRSMDQDGGRYNTTIGVLKERVREYKELQKMKQNITVT